MSKDNRYLSVQQRLDNALRENDHASVYKIAQQKLKKDPSNQLAMKLALFGSKHDNNTFPEVLKYKDLIKFPQVIESQIDYEALLMLLDIIHACESLAEALRYVSAYVDRLSAVNTYYNELLLSTLGVKFAAFSEPEIAFKYHERAMKVPGASFLSTYNYGYALMSFGRLAEARAPYKSRWKWPGFPSVLRQFDCTELPLESLDTVDKASQIIVWTEQGIGDQLCWMNAVLLLQDLGFDNITFEVHSKLHSLMRDSFEGIELIAAPYTVEAFDSRGNPQFQHYDFQVSCLDLWLRLQRSFDDYRAVDKVLKFKNSYGDELRKSIIADQPGKILIGLHWASGLMDPVRNRTYLTVDELKLLSALNDRVVFLSFNYALSVSQVEEIRTSTGLNIVAISGIDQKNSLYETTSLMRALDLFIGIYSAPTWQAVFSGIPTVSIEFSENPAKAVKKPRLCSNHKNMTGIAGHKAEPLLDIVRNFDNVVRWAESTR